MLHGQILSPTLTFFMACPAKIKNPEALFEQKRLRDCPGFHPEVFNPSMLQPRSRKIKVSGFAAGLLTLGSSY
jgi:hypothetical protein